MTFSDDDSESVTQANVKIPSNILEDSGSESIPNSDSDSDEEPSSKLPTKREIAPKKKTVRKRTSNILEDSGSDYIPTSDSDSDEEPSSKLPPKREIAPKKKTVRKRPDDSQSEYALDCKSDEKLLKDELSLKQRPPLKETPVNRSPPKPKSTPSPMSRKPVCDSPPPTKKPRSQTRDVHDSDDTADSRVPSNFYLGEDDVRHFRDNPTCWFRRILKSSTTKSGKPKKSSRVYNSYQWCDYCQTKVSNWAQHTDRKHKLDVENDWDEYRGKYSHLSGIDVNSAEAHKIKNLIRLEHNHRYNLESLKHGGEIFLDRRTSENGEDEEQDENYIDLKDFGPCHRCKAWTRKRQLWRHQRSCICNKTAKGDAPLCAGHLSTLSDIIAERMSFKCQMLTDEVLNKLRVDEVGEIARSDNIILLLGKMWISKNVGNLLKRGKYTAQVMRLVSNFLKNYRKITNNPSATLWQVLKPENYRNIVYAVITTATHDLQNVTELKAPSNSIKMGFEIKRALAIKVAESILSKDITSRDEAEELLKVVNIYWSTDVTKQAKVVLLDRQFNKVTYLPDPEDVVKFNDCLNTYVRQTDLTTTTPENFKKVAGIGGAKLTLYNRRRPLEVENLQ